MEKKYKKIAVFDGVRDSLIIGDPNKAAGFMCFGGSIYIAAQKMPSDVQRVALQESFGIGWFECGQLFPLEEQ